MEESQASWWDLPPELWPLIGERLHTYIDVVRFRSVCRSWRDSLPKLSVIFPPLLPPPIQHSALRITFRPRNETLLFQRIIYRFSPSPDHHHNSIGAASKGWLCKIESANLADKRFERPFYSNKSFNKEVLKEVNLLDYRIQEVARSYVDGYINAYTSVIPLTYKPVVHPDSDSIVVEILFSGKLTFREREDMFWLQQIGDKGSRFDDAIVYRGKLYTVDRKGRVFSIDSSMELVQFSPPIITVSGDLKHLVECGGRLYVVDRFVERKAGVGVSQGADSCDIHFCGSTTIDFKVHMLVDDENRGGRRWAEVENLGDEAFVVGVDSFSVSAADLEGFQGSCIYFSHELRSDMGCGSTAHVFHLEKPGVMDSSLQILRAPLVLLQPPPPPNHNNHSSSK